MPLLVRATDLGSVTTDQSPAFRLVSITDEDNDGVDDAHDLCPGTPAGTAVNAYGCPKTVATCDYTTRDITLTNAGGSGGGTVRYVLADSVGTILQVSATSSFSGLIGSHTYMALAISYDGAVTGLTVGQSLSAVSSSCFDWSTALVLKVCVPATCDYTVGTTITLNTTGGSTIGGTQTRYILVNAAGVIIHLSTNPVFSTTGLAAGTYSAYSIIYTDDASITNLQTGNLLSSVSANCFNVSNPFSLMLCQNCIPKCIPVTISFTRRR